MGFKRSQEEKSRLSKLYNETKNSYGSGAWFDKDKGRFIRVSLNSNPGSLKFWRKQTNKRARKTDDISNGNSYRKIFDYWWTIT